MGFDLLGLFVFGWEFYSSFYILDELQGKPFIFFGKSCENFHSEPLVFISFFQSLMVPGTDSKEVASVKLRMGNIMTWVFGKNIIFPLLLFFFAKFPVMAPTKPWLTHFKEACEQIPCIYIIITYRGNVPSTTWEKSYCKLMTVLFQAALVVYITEVLKNSNKISQLVFSNEDMNFHTEIFISSPRLYIYNAKLKLLHLYPV